MSLEDFLSFNDGETKTVSEFSHRDSVSTSSTHMSKHLNMHRAKSLHRQGIITDDTKYIVKKLILQDTPEISAALSRAASSNDFSLLEKMIKDGKNDFGGNGSKRINGNEKIGMNERDLSYSNFDTKSRKSDATITKEDVEFEESSNITSVGEIIAPPHPYYGGFSGRLPTVMHMVRNNFVGHILVRVSSKKLFRKWKIMFFALNSKTLSLYETLSCWETNQMPRMEVAMHSLMFICKPIIKRTYSAMDTHTERQIYVTVFRENVIDHSLAYSAPSAGKKFSPALESKRICKFGAYDVSEATALAYAIHGVIKDKVSEVNRAKSGQLW